MRRFREGDEIVLTSKVSRATANRRLRAGLRGRVKRVDYDNPKKHKQWVVVDIFTDKNAPLGSFRLPSSWLVKYSLLDEIAKASLPDVE